MSIGRAFSGSNQLGFPVTLSSGEVAYAIGVVLIDETGAAIGRNATASTASDLDTAGNPVPTYKAHSYTYDPSGNLATDTVSDGVNTWVRSYAYAMGAQSSDSGWVKQ